MAGAVVAGSSVQAFAATTQTVDGENSEINNVEGNQYKDNAIHNDSGDNG